MRHAARATACALLLATADAQAHGASPALGSFGSGFIHPLLEPAQLVTVVVVALLLGQPGFERTRGMFAAMAAGLVPGLALAGAGVSADADAALLALAAVTGLLVALGRSWPLPLPGAIAAIAGAGIGLGSALESGTAMQRLLALAGTFAGTVIWTTNGALLVDRLRQPWGRILVRIVGSWMAAVALLVLALQFAPARGA